MYLFAIDLSELPGDYQIKRSLSNNGCNMLPLPLLSAAAQEAPSHRTREDRKPVVSHPCNPRAVRRRDTRARRLSERVRAGRIDQARDNAPLARARSKHLAEYPTFAMRNDGNNAALTSLPHAPGGGSAASQEGRGFLGISRGADLCFNALWKFFVLLFNLSRRGLRYYVDTSVANSSEE